MKQESRFLEALPQTTRFYLVGQKLIFENKEKSIRLEFIEMSE
jgi:heat shock protein HslJ